MKQFAKGSFIVYLLNVNLVIPEINFQKSTKVFSFTVKVLLQLLDDCLILKINVNHILFFMFSGLHNVFDLLFEFFDSAPIMRCCSLKTLVREYLFKIIELRIILNI